MLGFDEDVRPVAINESKFEVLHEMEEHFVFRPFAREWEVHQKNPHYEPLTGIEGVVPMVFAALYGVVLVYWAS